MINDLAPHVVMLLVLAAAAAGFVDSIAGGGGLITIPALLAAGVSPVSALATNKIQACFGSSTSTWTYWRAGMIDFGHLRAPLIATLIGTALGSLALMVADPHWLMVVLPILLLGIAVYFLVAPAAADLDSHARLTPLAYAGVAGAIGFYDGFFGPGSGSFYALSLLSLLGMGLTRATAHAKALNLMSNVVSVAVLAMSGHLLWLVGLAMGLGQFAGGRLGSRTAMRFGPRVIRPLLVAVSAAMTIKLLADPSNPLRVIMAGW
jgi:uncharacterized membrane protein YfcA